DWRVSAPDLRCLRPDDVSLPVDASPDGPFMLPPVAVDAPLSPVLAAPVFSPPRFFFGEALGADVVFSSDWPGPFSVAPAGPFVFGDDVSVWPRRRFSPIVWFWSDGLPPGPASPTPLPAPGLPVP